MITYSQITSCLKPYFLFLLGCCLLLSKNTIGQVEELNLSDKAFREIKRSAKSALRTGDVYSALFYYEEWANRDSSDGKIIYQTADLYRLSRNYIEAEKWYLRVPKEEEKLFGTSLFYLSEVLIAQGKYKEAKKKLLEFKKELKDIKDQTYRKWYKIHMLSCDFALERKDSNKVAAVKNLGNSINLPHIEFSPIAVDENTLIYGSLREKGLRFYEADKQSNIPKRALYVAQKEEGKWIAKGELKGPFNSSGNDVGNAVLSEDGKRMYYTLCEENWEGKIICHLYYTDKNEGKWSAPIKMNGEINLPNYTTTQPAIGKESKKNNEVIYFVSDRPGGKGSLDIWYTEYNKKRKKFKSPRNAGSKINTIGIDCTPFYDLSSHRLYYSSNGAAGFGGLDVFGVVGEKNRWEEAENMMAAINSSADDLDFTLLPNGKSGYLVSNREGGASLLSSTCCDDIYEFSYLKFVDLFAKGKINDDDGCLTNYRLNLYIKDTIVGDRYLSKQYEIDSCGFNIPLKKGSNYEFEIEKDGYFNSTISVSTNEVTQSKEFTINSSLVKVTDKPILLKNILYKFDSAELTEKAKKSVDKYLYTLLISNKTLIVQIGSHTDSKGKDAYNLKLSERRAKSIVDYLIEKGISPDRLKSRGYGELKPIAPNVNEDGTDNPEGRKQNRRTEFIVVGKLTLIKGEASDD